MFSIKKRIDGDSDHSGLVRRVLDAAQLSEHLVATQKKQAQRQVDKVAKTKQNKKTISKIPQANLRASEEETKGKNSVERSALHQKAKEKAQASAITEARKNVKADRAKKWEEAKGKKSPDQKPPKTKLDSAEKDQVKKALGDAAHRMQNTANIPHNKDEFDVGGRAYSLLQPFSPHLKFTPLFL